MCRPRASLLHHSDQLWNWSRLSVICCSTTPPLLIRTGVPASLQEYGEFFGDNTTSNEPYPYEEGPEYVSVCYRAQIPACCNPVSLILECLLWIQILTIAGLQCHNSEHENIRLHASTGVSVCVLFGIRRRCHKRLLRQSCALP